MADEGQGMGARERLHPMGHVRAVRHVFINPPHLGPVTSLCDRHWAFVGPSHAYTTPLLPIYHSPFPNNTHSLFFFSFFVSFFLNWINTIYVLAPTPSFYSMFFTKYIYIYIYLLLLMLIQLYKLIIMNQSKLFPKKWMDWLVKITKSIIFYITFWKIWIENQP